jgi:hypothetical protein
VRAWSVAVAGLCLAVASGGCLGSGGGLFGGGGPGPTDYVSGDQYTKWVIEVDTIEGQSPPGGVLDFVRSRLAAVVDKPDGVEVRIDETLPARGGTWSQKDLLDYSDAHFGTGTGSKTVAIHLLFVDGTYDQGNVLGATFSRETNSGKVVETGPVVIFSERIEAGCGPLCPTGTAPAFRAVTLHEFGHAIGLVNNGVEMVRDHEDDAHPGHSANRNSVMYWEVETSGIFNLLGGPPTEFDGDDRADLCAAGGRCP